MRRAGVLLAAMMGIGAFLASLAGAPAAAGKPGSPTLLHDQLPDGRAVVDFAISPDSRTVVYIANIVADDRFDLWTALITGGSPTRISSEPTRFGGVQSFAISPDGSTVVYWADNDINDVFELYSVPLAGGPVTKLNRPLTAGGDVHEYVITADSSRVIYLADAEANERFELYSVPIRGGPSVRLNPDLPLGGDVQEPYHVSNDSGHVVFVADVQADNVFELYSTPAAGGTPVKLSGPLPPGGTVLTQYAITENSETVVFQADTTIDGQFELFAVPVAGGTPVAVWRPPGVPDSSTRWVVQLTPDSSTVVFHNLYTFETQAVGLYAAPLDGSTGRRLSFQEGHGSSFDSVQITADSRHVAFLANNRTWRAYSVPVAGGPEVRLSGKRFVGVSGLTITPDGETVLFRARHPEDGSHVYASSITGDGRTQVSQHLPDAEFIWGDLHVSSDSRRVVYRARSRGFSAHQVHSAPISGGTVVRLDNRGNDSSSPHNTGIEISADSQRVVFQSEMSANDTVELHVTDAGIRCGDGFATIVGSSGPDMLLGTDGPDVIAGLGGADTIRGLGGRDVLCGGRGRDVLRGGAGADQLYGGRGGDRLQGGRGTDQLDGGGGMDHCRGGRGIDLSNRCELDSAAT